ncbi:nitrogen fixation protein FixH [Pedobacter polaris]|uniref:Nitrogen fixation protein FixH n=1 Tax=Pedobacter polaris TaxID=2571273 RepID=A0A4V5P069_9SPHI|nr:FixH family protein [Pedobacter polaris]TKC12392.1 nitrogen fixation protein FixH [Pedobacter polaris]
MNWGTKIVLGMITFMLFIICMVVYMFSVHGNDALVDEDYYEKGINYNQEYNAKQNVITDGAQPKITVSNSQIIIQLKDSANYELKLMRPSTTKNDIKDKGNTVGDSNLILIGTKNMHSGLWFLELKWTCNGKNYFFKKDITL